MKAQVRKDLGSVEETSASGGQLQRADGEKQEVGRRLESLDTEGLKSEK